VPLGACATVANHGPGGRLCREVPNELLFTAPKGGVLWLRNWRRRVFDPAVEGAGLGQLSPHELRHTAASLAVAAGANIKAVQRTLGHASAAMTLDVYSGLFDDDLDAVADRLDVAAQSARESSRGLSADFLRTDGQLITLQDRTETLTAQQFRALQWVELRGLEPLTPTLPAFHGVTDCVWTRWISAWRSRIYWPVGT
jgi:Phage integrase family